MIVLSHRGYWRNAAERNTEMAFRRSFDEGFGTETDVRDLAGELVISHDTPLGREMKVNEFLDLLPGAPLPIALNIKADGLASKLARTMCGYNPNNWFVFDMSTPDLRAHLQIGNPAFTRISEVEREPIWLEEAVGVWIDAFGSNWFGTDTVADLMRRRKRVCIVSPELHGREPKPLWQELRGLPKHGDLMLCTDFPEQARTFFGDQQ